MARQIKTFKRKYRHFESILIKIGDIDEESCTSIYKSSQKIIKKSWKPNDPIDHKNLLKNLFSAIADGRLSTSSDDFDIICKLVRDCMPMHLLNNIYKHTANGKLINKNENK